MANHGRIAGMDFWTMLTRGNALVSLIERVAPERTQEPTFQEAKAELVRAAERSKALGGIPLAWPALAWAVGALGAIAGGLYIGAKVVPAVAEAGVELVGWAKRLTVLAGLAFVASYVLPSAASTYRQTFARR